MTTTTTTTIIILSATAIILFSTLCMAHAPSPGMELPLAPKPSTPLGPSAPATNDCFTLVLNTLDCLIYVEELSKLTVSDKNCCPELAGLMDNNPTCLCEMLTNISLEASYGNKIDISKVLELPSVCGVNTPLSTCSDVEPWMGLLASTPLADNNDSGASNVAGYGQSFFFGLPFLFHLINILLIVGNF
ncbi:non-specific lipid transfer protein GPI-anchored 12-like [Hevea brasiliensis]|uniref:non-specific lipid transfer protein GPI-anchored 12-like n=1 Tax=Hevea brasiliensis TaxID=3981 RepID=UPI0025E6033B|nr:non-specific lipid transfer protein GPI-anchored 12-like [Hevea brasiliensis]